VQTSASPAAPPPPDVVTTAAIPVRTEKVTLSPAPQLPDARERPGTNALDRIEQGMAAASVSLRASVGPAAPPVASVSERSAGSASELAPAAEPDRPGKRKRRERVAAEVAAMALPGEKEAAARLVSADRSAPSMISGQPAAADPSIAARIENTFRTASLPSPATRPEAPAPSREIATRHAGRGIASIYSGGSRTANGERLNTGAFTAAHRSLPFGTMVKVTNKKNGRSIMVRINDRGPFVRGRVIDITPVAAKALGFSGLADVTLAVAQRD
jgi:rare lipoprotein A